MRNFAAKIALAATLITMAFAGPASAATVYNPDPPVAGQDLTISNSVDWTGCTATSGTWTYTQTTTLIAPDGTETVFSVISETGSSPSGAITVTGSDTQTLPAISGTYAVETQTSILCGRLGQLSKSIGSISVAEDANVPVADPLVGSLAAAGVGGAFLLVRRRKADTGGIQ